MDKQRILIVDDESSLTWILKLNLERTGRYEVRTENEGSRAFLAAKQFHPDLVLLDLMMPDLDGGSVAAQLQADPATHGMPIVFLTAAIAQDEMAMPGALIGGYPFLAKPVSLEQVLACVKEHIGTNGGGAP